MEQGTKQKIDPLIVKIAGDIRVLRDAAAYDSSCTQNHRAFYLGKEEAYDRAYTLIERDCNSALGKDRYTSGTLEELINNMHVCTVLKLKQEKTYYLTFENGIAHADEDELPRGMVNYEYYKKIAEFLHLEENIPREVTYKNGEIWTGNVYKKKHTK